MTHDDLSLAVRDKLPDALRVLLEDYPREAWEADPNFSGLIRFWLDRHLMFRRVLAVLGEETEKALDRDMEARSYAAHLSRYGSMFAGELHGHHAIEDAHYFPHLKMLDGRLERGFDILDRDHHAIDAHLADFAEDANGVLRAVGEGGVPIDAMAKFKARMSETNRFLDRHLTDEEELVVPVLLKFAPAGLV